MKKKITFIFACLLLLFGVTSCHLNNSDNKNNDINKPSDDSNKIEPSNPDNDDVVEPDVYYTVYYKYEAGTLIGSATIKSTELLQEPTTPTKTGYTFKGWYLKNSGTPFVFNNKITSNLSLYAKFEISNVEPDVYYTVYYKYEDGTLISSTTIKSTELLQEPTVPTKVGYTFDGWYLDGSSTKFVFNTSLSSDIILFAKFVLNSSSDKINLSFDDSYYSYLNGNLDKKFKAKLHKLLENTHKTKLSYSGVWNGLLRADADPNNSGSVICIYTGQSLSKRDQGSSGNDLWNREHLWPRSLGFKKEGMPAHNDIHHLHASEKNINNTRGNKFFGEITSGSSDNYGNKWNSTLFEPRDEVKGDIARSLFYMVVRYETDDCTCNLDLELVPNNKPSSSTACEMGNLLTLLKWHYEDPVSSDEIRRNNTVYGIQGNRNPFIDHPEFVSYLYTSLVSDYTDTSKLRYLI